DLKGAKLPDYNIVPLVGKFVAWKATKNHILKIGIPSDAKRTSTLVGRKCRASKIVVLGIYSKSGDLLPNDTKSISMHDSKTIYKYTFNYVPILSDKYDDDISIECTHGIHFFMTVKEVCDWLDIKDKKVPEKILNGGK
ncbi:MAG: DUF5758 domain-containing protein, partial [Saprospiraceae bacterium]